MKITKIESIPFKLPVRREFKWAGLQESVGGFVCIRIETDEGIVGYGEATPCPIGVEIMTDVAGRPSIP